MASSRGRSRSASTHAGRYARPTILDRSDERMEDDEALLIYRWLDTIEFTRSKKTAANRDFSDGVMMAELIAHYIPKIINTTFYTPTSATSKKIDNWDHLNKKVLKRIGFQFTLELIKDLAAARPGVIERVLKMLQPSLLQGPRAVIPLLRRLENVKPRFMDFDRYFQRRNITRPTTAAATSDFKARPAPSSSRPRSAEGKTSGRPHKPSQRRSPFRAGVTDGTSPTHISFSSSTPGEEILEPGTLHSVTPISERIPNYELVSRPSTAKSPPCSEVFSPGILLDENNNVIDPSDNPQKDLHQDSMMVAHVPRKKRGFPSRTSWLPVYCGDGGNIRSTPHNVLNATDDDEADGTTTSRPTTERPNDAEEDVDEEIFCDHSGYDEDTEDNGGVSNDEEDSNFGPSAGDTPVASNERTKRPKRKLKRVVKYEYREEYILNGMATYQLPSNQELEKIRRNYMNSGSSDPNCRGYGFV